ncbi:unnamed protein product [Cuscuta epithymum]|uniref:Receptor-like serine/threonine-protein kinase n=1 Tax=Cuscuta epithymum TaxID=186058 RepID=A0AAV0CMV9_9ASTE|nr:unnamed protein product [Cuscuta epithymum]
MGRQYFIFASSLSFLVCFSSSTDTITFNQTLKDGDFLLSNSKSFALGFFTPANSIGKRYLGIWFQQIPVQTVVWVANRDTPVNGPSGILLFDAAGNLVVRDQKSNVSVWSTNLNGSKPDSRYSSAQLLDSGNLVFHPDVKGIPTWQSFDYPTNTLLPSMKLWVDKKSGGGPRFLSSWKSSDDPSTGQYTFGMELTGSPQVFLYRSWARIWRTGPWNGVELSGAPEVSQTHGIISLNYTDTVDEVSVTYSLRDPSVHSILVLNESGTVNRLVWQGKDKGWVGVWSAPEDKCDVYGGCGAFSTCNLASLDCSCLTGYEPKSTQEGSSIGGCVRGSKTATSLCHSGEGFIKLTKVKIPDAKMAVVNRTIGLKECEGVCLSNCSCMGYASSNITSGGMGCITWYGDLIDIRELSNGGQDMYIRASAADLKKLEMKSRGHHGPKVIIKVSLAFVAVAAILLLSCLIMKNRKGKRQKRNIKNLVDSNLQSYDESLMVDHVDETGSSDLSIYALKTMQAATDNFSEENKLGQGGFGSVYKGKLPNGQLVAIKRLSRTSGQGAEEFKNEVTLIAKLQHRNLVKLLGCCIQQGEKMLVYEHLPNKGLDSFIFDSKERESLDWAKRFEIILGIARGLLYLHRDSRLRIIHRDLKASNVLLDASMNPKISDFGMARIFGTGQNQANTNRVVGTYGYMSPEYAMEGQFSVKSDVFSFGVLLLEIVCGRKNKNPYKENSLNLIGDMWDLWREGTALDLVDPLLGKSYDGGQVLRCIHVGLLCVQAMQNDRPTMSEVVFMLCNETQLPTPNRPGFILLRKETCLPSSSTSTTKSNSVNSLSMTKIEGR